MRSSKKFYSLCIEDIQDVAQDCLGRDLSEEELTTVIPEIERRIPWYDAIYDSIWEKIDSKV